MNAKKKTTAGGVTGLTIKTGIRGGRLASNHSRGALKVKTAMRGGRLAQNHSRTALAAR